MQLRQGDVFLARVRAVPSTAILVTDPRVILAHGEVTGHAHEVIAAPTNDPLDGIMPAAQLFDEPDGMRYLLVHQPCVLTHQEHAPIALAPGAYRVVRQREYTPEAIRTVAD